MNDDEARDEELNLEVSGLSQASYVALRVFLTNMPLVGATLTEVFAELLASPTQRRQTQVLSSLIEKFVKHDIDLEELKKRLEKNEDEIYDTIVFAVSSSVKTSSSEKRDALRNAVLNVVIGTDLEKHRQEEFLFAIQELSPLHLRLLAFLDDIRGGLTKRGMEVPDLRGPGAARWQVVSPAFPEFQNDRPLLDRVMKALFSRHFTGTDTLGGMSSGDSCYGSCVTQHGRDFLNFITEPEARP